MSIPEATLKGLVSDRFLLNFLDDLLPQGRLWYVQERPEGSGCYELTTVLPPGPAGAAKSVRTALTVARVAKEWDMLIGGWCRDEEAKEKPSEKPEGPRDWSFTN